MRVIADQNLANIEELLADTVELTLMPGREITASSVQGHDALLVRSITRVDAALLTGSDIRFVGTATSGLDHIEREYLAGRGIALAHAAGSNADAVVDYCLSALAHLGFFESSQPATVGILGFGQVGSRLHRRLSAMGIATRLCDPLVARELAEGGAASCASVFVDCAELAQCDVVSLHVPLTIAGPHPTADMIGYDFLAGMASDACLIHTCRGGVLDEAALLRLLNERRAPRCAIDVWLNEPAVNPELAASVDLATPHIAGYSARAKKQASQQVVSQLHEFMVGSFKEESGTPDYAAALEFGASQHAVGADASQSRSVAGAIRSAFDLPALDERFKKALRSAENGRLSARVFDGFRNELRERPEFSELNPSADHGGPEFLSAAGFSVAR